MRAAKDSAFLVVAGLAPLLACVGDDPALTQPDVDSGGLDAGHPLDQSSPDAGSPPACGRLELVPGEVTFGERPVGYSDAPPTPITLRNVGTSELTIELSQPQPAVGFSLAWKDHGPVVLPPGAKVPELVGTFVPTARGDWTASASIKVTAGTACPDVPIVQMRGRAAATPIIVEDPALHWDVECGRPAGPAKQLRVRNLGSVAVPFDAVLGKGAGSPVSLALPASKELMPGDTLLSVTPKAAARGGGLVVLNDTLTISTQAPEDTPDKLPITVSQHGAMLRTGQDNDRLMAWELKAGGNQRRVLSVSNSGDRDVKISITIESPSQVFSFVHPAKSTSATRLVPKNALINQDVYCAPANAGEREGRIVFALVDGVLCSSLPPTIALRCTSTP